MMRSTLRIAMFSGTLVGILSQAFCSSSGSGDDACQKLLDCCSALAPALQAQCQAVYDQWHQASEAQKHCQQALSSISGQCRSTDGGNQPASDVGVSDAAGTSPSGPCSTYIQCVAQTTPAGLDPILAAYGKNGSCWLQGNAALCDEACWTGIVAAHKLYPGAEACNLCRSFSDCSAPTPACSPTTHQCIECQSDSDCDDGSKPACDIKLSRCVPCTADYHCQGMVCDTVAARCVECLKQEDCPSYLICDVATKSCRHCKADSECKTNACADGSCVECKGDAQCGDAKPYCGPLHACIQCKSDADCTPGACDFISGTCCGATACSFINAECGLSIDLACLFTPIPCGACATGKTCVDHTCLPTPAKNCSGCPSAQCGYIPDKNVYQCVSYSASCTKTIPCEPGYLCQSEINQYSGNTYYYCARYCLTDQDCNGGLTCVPLQGPTSYGLCKVP